MSLGYDKAVKEIIKVLKKTNCLALAIGVSVLVMLVYAWIPNWDLIKSHGSVRLLIALSGSLFTNLHTIDLVMLAITAVLTGVQVALVVSQLVSKSKIRARSGMGVVGIVASILGVGCAGCGSMLLTSVLGLTASGAILHLLPFRGVEIWLLGIVILVISIRGTVRGIEQAEACELV